MSHPYQFNRAISRRPGASVVKGLRAGGGPDPSLEGVLAEHAAYVAALEAAGLAVTLLDPLEDFPDAIFVEDPALVFPDCAILLNPGTESRAGEGAFLRPTLAAMFETVLDLPEGHADGGDVLAMDGAMNEKAKSMFGGTGQTSEFCLTPAEAQKGQEEFYKRTAEG
ncbi:MAG: dimethylarginine dimethylaminohydrolase, partial [Novosphingobium sp.]